MNTPTSCTTTCTEHCLLMLISMVSCSERKRGSELVSRKWDARGVLLSSAGAGHGHLLWNDSCNTEQACTLHCSVSVDHQLSTGWFSSSAWTTSSVTPRSRLMTTVETSMPTTTCFTSKTLASITVSWTCTFPPGQSKTKEQRNLLHMTSSNHVTPCRERIFFSRKHLKLIEFPQQQQQQIRPEAEPLLSWRPGNYLPGCS